MLQLWPARLVPPPRGVIGTSCALQSRTVATTSAGVLGITTPIGHLPVIGGVGGVERAVADREAHFAFEGGFQSGLEFIDLFLRNFDALVADRVRWIRAGLERGGCARDRSVMSSLVFASVGGAQRQAVSGSRKVGGDIPS